jgi:hypothetical protein
MTEFLDTLARSMARPMPRSRALRLLGGVLVAGAVPGALRTSAALGGARASRRMGTCSPRCPTPAFPVPFACPVAPAKDICFITCGPPGSTKCCFFEGGKPSGIVACPDGYRCGAGGEKACVPEELRRELLQDDRVLRELPTAALLRARLEGL